jgi:hypothetical protein
MADARTAFLSLLSWYRMLVLLIQRKDIHISLYFQIIGKENESKSPADQRSYVRKIFPVFAITAITKIRKYLTN